VRRLTLAGLAVGLVALAAPVGAHAANTYWYWEGGCDWNLQSATTGNPNQYTGVVRLDAALLHDLALTPGTIRCDLYVDGQGYTTVLGPTHTDTGVVVDVPATVTFTVPPDTYFDLCTVATFDLEPTHTQRQICPGDLVYHVPPPESILLDTVGGVYGTVFGAVDPAVCDRLRQVPSVPPLLYVDPNSGDTWIGGNDPSDKVYDCPLYDS
jgi:hypothetical protein